MGHKDPVKRRAYDATHRDRLNACHRAWNAAHRDERHAAHRAWRAANPAFFLRRLARRRAKVAGVPCTLTLADVRALLAPMRCSATGLPLVHAKGAGAFTALSPSLDRIIPAMGYVPGNVRLVCHRFNMLRGTDPVSHDFRHALRVLAETSHLSDRGVIDHETTRRAAA